jgi:hypothetical protein
LSIISTPAAPAAADVNLNVRGFAAVNARTTLVDIDGPADAGAPQLATLFTDRRAPTFNATFQLNDWDKSGNNRGALITDPEVTLVSLAVNSGELILVPESSYSIGDGNNILVIYADAERIVFTYTREDSVIRGYVVFLEGIAVESNLVTLYQQRHNAGRTDLPALRVGQAFARARGTEVKLAIRDAGAFLDPRSRKDWWRGK